jgi:hypothetical protein
MYHFCTLFDSHYLSRGIALYESLLHCCKDFHLYIFAFDGKCTEILNELNLKKATIISLQEFEDKELLALKPGRSTMEYCWTCTPSIILYSLDKFNLDMCTYIDADIYFWKSPEALFDELGNKSIVITEHRYTKRYDASSKSGKYCVQFMTFKNDMNGRKALNWWRESCNTWCYARHEDGKFGDQKYLDEWLEKFEGVHVLQHLGGGLAPWNVQQYDILNEEGKTYCREKSTGIEFEPVFFHFHRLWLYTNGRIDLGGYYLSREVKSVFYKPYVRHLSEIADQLIAIENSPDVRGETDMDINALWLLVRHFKRLLFSNILDKREFLNKCQNGEMHAK